MSSAERLPTDQCTRDAIATHRMMTSILVETERYLAKLRASAEAEAAEIIGSAEDEAWALVRATHDEITTMFDVARERARLRIVEARGEAHRIRTGAALSPSASDGGPGSEASRSEGELGPEATPPLGHGPGRVRVSAVLQVIAVVTILAFILFQPT